ncbi:MAG: pyridoxamine 5'-phosphate oxidase family protein [Flavobacteriales bacterium]
MGNTEQLNGRTAIEKAQEIVEHQGLCMMVTDVGNYPGHSRPMAVGEVDDNGVFWFLTLRTTEKFDELTKDPRMSLHFANPSDQEFMTIHGRTEVENDVARKKELWNPLANAWVPDGVDNPDLRILKVTPTDGYYWDTKNGKVVAGIKIAFAAITGGTSDDGGVEGRLKV